MTTRSLAMTALVLAGLLNPAGARAGTDTAPTTPPRSGGEIAPPRSRAATPVATTRAMAPRRGTRRGPGKADTRRHAPSAASHAAGHATPAPAAPRPAPPRTLDDIHIEGEIPVPQILFITARDQRRFMEFQSRRYLRSAREVGAAAALPSRIVVTSERPTPHEEITR
jgi:hypothetical protein